MAALVAFARVPGAITEIRRATGTIEPLLDRGETGLGQHDWVAELAGLLTPPAGEPPSPVRRWLRNKLEYLPPDALKPHPRNTNRHSKRQIKKLADLIARLGFINPIIVDDQDRVVAGEARLAAAKAYNLPELCIIRLSHLSPAELRAYMIADNAIGRESEFDDALLAGELSDLLPLLSLEGHDGNLTGLDIPKIDLLLSHHVDPEGSLEDEIPAPSKEIVSRLGDQWELGEHSLRCGDAKSPNATLFLLRPVRPSMRSSRSGFASASEAPDETRPTQNSSFRLEALGGRRSEAPLRSQFGASRWRPHEPRQATASGGDPGIAPAESALADPRKGRAALATGTTKSAKASHRLNICGSLDSAGIQTDVRRAKRTSPRSGRRSWTRRSRSFIEVSKVLQSDPVKLLRALLAQ